MRGRWRVDCVVGARPNFVKMAPILRALAADGRFATRLLHTGQHYDVAMNAVFFQELELPHPDVNLDIGSGSGVEQTARVMLGLETALAERPDMLIVVGDVNSTLAAALVASKMRIPLAHVEAGLHSGDRAMPEEINRIVTDQLSDLLLTTERSAAQNLRREGVAQERVVFVGNVMIDSLHFALARAAPPERALARLGCDAALMSDGFGLVTLHRPSNVDDPERLARLLLALERVGESAPLIFPAHPRTQAVMARHGLAVAAERVKITPPLPYLEAVALMRAAHFVITDSGGVQEETTALGVPCFTFRDNTERPITIDEGTNHLIGTNPEALVAAVEALYAGQGKAGRAPELWDGRAAPRIVSAITAFLSA